MESLDVLRLGRDDARRLSRLSVVIVDADDERGAEHADHAVLVVVVVLLHAAQVAAAVAVDVLTGGGRRRHGGGGRRVVRHG